MQVAPSRLGIAPECPNASRDLLARGMVASVPLLMLLALFLVTRRVTGAMTAPLAPGLLIVTALVMLAWAWSVRNSCRSIGALPPLILLMGAFACSYPGGRLVDWLVWVPVIVASRWPPRMPLPAKHRSRVIGPQPQSERVQQQLTRIRTAEGAEVVYGTMAAEFERGARTATLHAAFCPPFERLPQVEVHAADDSDVTVKVAQVLHHGVRLDVRLARPAVEPHAVTVELTATERAEA